MEINLSIGELGQKSLRLNCTGLDWFEIVLVRLDLQGHWRRAGVALTPYQAVEVAWKLNHPPGQRWVPYVGSKPEDRKGGMRDLWHIFNLKSVNHREDSILGVGKGQLGIEDSCCVEDGVMEDGPTEFYGFNNDYFDLTPQQIKQLTGVMFHWAGAAMIGLTEEVVTERREYM